MSSQAKKPFSRTGKPSLPPRQRKHQREYQKERQEQVTKKRLFPVFIAGLLVLIAAVALYLRIYLPYDDVFVGEWIKFTGNDAYYQMRLVDSLIANFPHLTGFDPYMQYPFGMVIDNIHFFNWLLAGIIWLIGLGAPTQQTIDVIGVYFPTILAALTVIPVYFIGKELFGRWAGILAAGLIAIMPGEFLGRSLLGFTDHHVAETLFTTTAMLFLILAVKTARERELTLTHFWHQKRAILSKPVLYSWLSGFFLGLYLITWYGALLFVFIFFVYFVAQFIIDHLKQQPTGYLTTVGVITFLTALIIYASVWRHLFSLLPVIIALLTPIVLGGISSLMINKKIRPTYYPLVLLGLGGLGLAIFYAIAPDWFMAMLKQFKFFNPNVPRTIMEMQYLLAPAGRFTLAIAWGNFTTGFFLGFISLGILLYLLIKQGRAEITLLVVWSLVILAATLGQRRFAYYFAINVSLLTGYFAWQPFRLIKKYQDSFSAIFRYTVTFLFVIIIFFLVFYNDLKLAIPTAQDARFAPSNAWMDSLIWLKEKTPEPFGQSDFYYQRHEPPPPKEPYQPPESAYGVMSWGDYGYWIARIARRPANLTPGPGGEYVARFFLSQEEESKEKTKWERETITESEIIQKLDAEYIMIDFETATGKFWALAQWAEKDKVEFFDIYYVPQGNRLVATILFHPPYYRSLVVRLYNFNARSVTPQKSLVIAYEERTVQKDVTIKVITEARTFPSYEEASSYIANQKSGNYRIVGDNPFLSPVPLPTLKHYQLIYSSPDSVVQPNVGSIPAVKIFKYTK